ncbi:MAG: SpoIID/LytB domain-containing protein [Cyanobacteria bacterium SIG30]|nr:SpoIID/LytB domain-containing protein [Cyanobacteria bacterium SIG30]
MRFLQRVVVLFVIVFFVASNVYAIEAKNIVRVGISNQNFSTFEHERINFVSNGNILLSDMTSEEKLEVKSGENLVVESHFGLLNAKSQTKEIKNLRGPLVITSDEKIGIVDLNRKGTPAFYSGQFEIISTNNKKFNLVNVLPMQEYLKGVVPNEMPKTFGLEALKAQAIAARNYVNRDVNSNKNYDVVDSTASQVYYGVNSHNELSNQAVDETNGIYALYEREPIIALYFSTGSGITESWENVFGGINPKISAQLPYLTSVYDNDDYKKIDNEQEAYKFFSSTPESNDINSPKYRWVEVFSEDELPQILETNLKLLSKSSLVEPVFGINDEIGVIEDIKVLKRGESGKALLLEIKTDKGSWKVKKELSIRRLFRRNGRILNSANFCIEKEKEKSEKLAIFDSASKPKKYVYKFIGAGFGHSVGMSQYGAAYMASKGASYIEILKHYYTDIAIGTIPVKITGYGLETKLNFFHDKKYKVNLKLDNTDRISNFDFYVNDNEFRSELGHFSAKTLFFDITEYLVPGDNTITFKALSGKDVGKNVNVWIEVVE